MAGEGVCERQAHAQGHCCVSLSVVAGHPAASPLRANARTSSGVM
jgi:hypothetical protein